jgi:hypothetical protein
MAGRQQGSALDSRGARLVALAIALAALSLMIWIGREDVPLVHGLMTDVSGSAKDSAKTTGNPELDACLASRVGDVEKMREEGVINAAQYDAFRGRATAYCEAQFPPG